jgi:hypothetical protein
LAGRDSRIGAAADKLRRALEHRDPRRSIAATGIDVVTAGTEQPKATLRKIDLEDLAVAELAQMKADTPPRKDDPGELVAQAHDFDLGAVRQVDRISADLELGDGSNVGPKGLACEDRLV